MKTTWDASLRGRIGTLLTPATLAYATGGVAWQHFEVSSTCVSDTCASIGISPAGASNSATKPGWTVGGGLETALWHHWLARIVGTAAIGFGRGGEQTAPLGRAVIGGLAFATVATLLVLPAVFAVVQARAGRSANLLESAPPNSTKT